MIHSISVKENVKSIESSSKKVIRFYLRNSGVQKSYYIEEKSNWIIIINLLANFGGLLMSILSIGSVIYKPY
jgi:hypothetical protein